MINETVTMMDGVEAGLQLVDWEDLDRSQVSGWIERLRAAEQSLRRARLRLETLDDDERQCAVCGETIAGRADRIYCGATCRQRARRGAQA